MGCIAPLHYLRGQKVLITGIGCAFIFFIIIFGSENTVTYTKKYLESFHKWKTKSSQGIKNLSESGPVPVVILTYMRSGSSFCGDVLQASDDVFYLFEPLRALQFHFRKSNNVYYLDGKNRSYANFIDFSVIFLKEIFKCNFENLPLPFFSDSLFLNKGHKSKEFVVCMNQKIATNANVSAATMHCAHEMKRSCLTSKYIMIKTIRSPLKIVVPLAEEFPKIKIVHLVRDPRATLYSQMFQGRLTEDHLHEYATMFCCRVYNDLAIAKHTSLFPSSLYFSISYESLAKYTLETTKKVYKFLEIDFNVSIPARLEKLTKADKTCGESQADKALCTKSTNSTADADKWRLSIPYSFVSTVDNVCHMLYSIVGLQSIPDEVHLRNLSFSLTRGNIHDLDDFRYA